MSTTKELWVYAEQREGKLAGVVQELLSEGQILCEKSGYTLCAVLPSANGAELCQELYNFGAKKVYTIDDPKLGLVYTGDEDDAGAPLGTIALIIDSKKRAVVWRFGDRSSRALNPDAAARRLKKKIRV